MKILYVIDNLGPGGAERSLHELVPELRAAGTEVLVVSLDPASDLEVAGGARTYETRTLDAASPFGRVRELRALLRNERPDIVHTSLFRSNVTGRLAAVRTGAVVMTSLVNTSYEPERLRDANVRRSRLALARAVDGFTARHLTAHFHAITEAVKESAVRNLRIRADRVTVIERGRDRARLGIPSPERRERARAALGIAGDAQVVVNIARQDPQKNQAVLVGAFERLAGANPDAVLVIAGRRGYASEELDALLARSAHADRIMMLGHREDVPEILAAADVFAFPSRYEGLGGAVIEAMALGLPVVASDLPALREVVVDGVTGVLARSEDAEALASALGRMLTDPRRAADMGARGLVRFEERFTLERSSARMIDLYRSLLTARRGG
ncbi:MAG: glycosyltransferase family 4 protein [Acidimicrobiia bacterium]|nr:glycosyltransferase family 4 protein [Acidimicrobiia bacterium]